MKIPIYSNFSKTGLSKLNLGVIGAMLLVAIVTRFVPHWPNFTAVGALALWSTKWPLPRWVRLPLALSAMLVTDLVLGFHNTLIWVYSGFLLVALLGEMLPLGRSAVANSLSALCGSLVFFTVTNFGVWMFGALYPQTISGLAECFLMALPFLHYQIFGDLLFVSFFAFLFSAVSSFRMTKTLPSRDS